MSSHNLVVIPETLIAVKNELSEISEAGAKGLKQQGAEIQPVKADMLRLPDQEAQLVVSCCEMLFAALCEYEQGLWDEDHATNAMQLVTSRVNAGRANAVIESLFYGPTAKLLWIALDRAPIAYSGLAHASPSQRIIDRTYKSNK
jgi:hypothetical protein